MDVVRLGPRRGDPLSYGSVGTSARIGRDAMNENNKISITICGDGGCGKSSITLRLVRSQWTHEYVPCAFGASPRLGRIDAPIDTIPQSKTRIPSREPSMASPTPSTSPIPPAKRSIGACGAPPT